MAISYNTGATASASTATSVDITIPSGVLVGDVMVLGLVVFNEVATPSTIGFSGGGATWLLPTPIHDSSNPEQTTNSALLRVYGYFYYAVATAGDPGATLTITETGSSGALTWLSVALASYTGAAASQPDIVGSLGVNNVASVTAPAETTGVNNDWYIGMLLGGTNSGSGRQPAGNATADRHVGCRYRRVRLGFQRHCRRSRRKHRRRHRQRREQHPEQHVHRVHGRACSLCRTAACDNCICGLHGINVTSYITGLTTDSSTGGYWHDQNSTPRFLMYDNPWALVFNSGEWNGSGGGTYQQDISSYMTSRGAQGFNGAYLSALGNLDNDGSYQDGRTWDGVYPFTANGTAGEITSSSQTLALNNPYWQRVDYVFSQAEAAGITILFNIAYTANASHGNFDPGGALDATVLSQTQYMAYGTAVAERYASSPNLIWMYGNDYFDGQYDTQMGYIRSAIIATGDTRDMSVHVYPESTSRYDIQNTSQGSNGSTFAYGNAQFNTVYTYNVTYFGVELAYKEAAAHSITQLPVHWGDGYFYDSGADIPTDQMMRQMAWWAISSGARGTNTGSNDIWPWAAGSPAAVTTGNWYTTEASIARTQVETLRNWQKLLPDVNSTLVTSGRGTHASGISTGSNYNGGTNDYVTASRVSDGSLAIIYGAKAYSITIDQTKMAAGYTATWLDPTNGTTITTTPGSTYSSSGLGNNSAGEPDWVLFLEGPASPVVNPPGPPLYGFRS